jgi:hypothetical protein
MAVFRTAFERWIDGTDSVDFPELIREALEELTALTTSR